MSDVPSRSDPAKAARHCRQTLEAYRSPPGSAGGPRQGETANPLSLGGASAGGGTASRRYSLVVSMQIRNLTNHNNPGPIIGNITSPLFGQANQPAGSGNAIFSENANNRRLELQDAAYVLIPQ